VIAAAKAQERIEKATGICRALAGTTSTALGDHAKFQVGGKIFAYLLNNHHGDGILGIWCRALPGDNQRLIEANPDRFYMPAYVGPRGWVGLRLDSLRVDWSEVEELIRGSYLLARGPRRKIHSRRRGF